jgi:hypothetical protein
MSRFLGEIRQVAYIVPDIEAAMDHWARVMGVGPWYYNPHVPIRNYHYRGVRHEPHNSVALANAGGLQIDLPRKPCRRCTATSSAATSVSTCVLDRTVRRRPKERKNGAGGA